MRIRTYFELKRLDTFEERYEYLKLGGEVGRTTFGWERYLNQRFYQSFEWRQVRQQVIARDLGNDLGLKDHEIFEKIIIHHMNPMESEDLVDSRDDILDPNFLITTTHRTHNAIHYGDKKLLAKPHKDRTPGDTRLW